MSQTNWRRFGAVVLVLGVVMLQVRYVWACRYLQIPMGVDACNFATLGRHFVEFGSLPPFLFPGKTYDGPSKPVIAYLPCLVFGYHDAIPWLMTALGCLAICFLCGLIARKMISPAAGW